MIDELRALAESNGLTIIDSEVFDFHWTIFQRGSRDEVTLVQHSKLGYYLAWSTVDRNTVGVTSAQQVIDMAKGNRDDGPKQSMDDTRARGSKRTVDGVIDALERIIDELESIEEDCKINRMYCDGAVELARNAVCHSLDLALLFKSSQKPPETPLFME
jgi:hypothetical protein